jgi:hypothetical protein
VAVAPARFRPGARLSMERSPLNARHPLECRQFRAPTAVLYAGAWRRDARAPDGASRRRYRADFASGPARVH